MRYTTVIDISEIPVVYRSINARLLYLHMALKAGYHDDDRDLLDASIRQLARDTGLTVSATRCALSNLLASKLIERQGVRWKVTKWLIQDIPGPRPKTAKQQRDQQREDAAKRYEEEQRKKELEKYRQEVFTAIRSSSKDELIEWLDELKAGKYLYHYGARIRPNQANIEWLTNIINQQ